LNDRRYPRRPILGVGAIIIEGERVLLVERGREPLKGYWSLPGGVLEVGEKLADGIRREVLEETGLKIELLSVVEIFERIMRDAAGVAEYHYVLIDYLCRVTGGALTAGDDVSQAKWVERASLPEYRITEGTLPVIEKAFQAL
jgi:ADP-ribose pyrophosphatase YjhB (NUDIX family)